MGYLVWEWSVSFQEGPQGIAIPAIKMHYESFWGKFLQISGHLEDVTHDKTKHSYGALDWA